MSVTISRRMRLMNMQDWDSGESTLHFKRWCQCNLLANQWQSYQVSTVVKGHAIASKGPHRGLHPSSEGCWP